MMLTVPSGFKIEPGYKVATAGSCFAQHLANGLQKSGFEYFVPEDNPALDAQTRKLHNYGIYSARYGNIYTTLQLLKMLQEAYELRQPQDQVWQGKDGRFYDPYRPAIEPDGFESEAALRASRETLYAAVRQIVEESDVFVFTLGLTETWRNRADGSVYPVVPGAVAGQFNPDQHEFLNMSHDQVRDSLGQALQFFSRSQLRHPLPADRVTGASGGHICRWPCAVFNHLLQIRPAGRGQRDVKQL
jgi:hypothetical protein